MPGSRQPHCHSMAKKKKALKPDVGHFKIIIMIFSMCIRFATPPPVDIVRACPKTGGSADPDHSPEERHQEASDRLHGPPTTEPGPGRRPHREFYHVSVQTVTHRPVTLGIDR